MITRILSMLICCGMAGCVPAIKYHQYKYDVDGNVVEETKVVYPRTVGNAQRECMFVIIGKKDDPQAVFYMGKSIITKDNTYEALKEIVPSFFEFAELFCAGKVIP